MIGHLKFPKLRQKVAITRLLKSCDKFYGTAGERSQYYDVPGYIILLPEVPPGAFVTSETNEILNHTAIPSTFKVNPKKIRDGIGVLSQAIDTRIWTLEESLKDPSYSIQEKLLKDLDTTDLEYAVSLLNIIHILETVPNYDGLMKRATAAHNAKYQSKSIYYSVKELLANDPKNNQLKYHVSMGKMNGLELTGEASESLQNVHKELNKKKLLFNSNVAEANAKFRHLIVDEKHLGSMSVSEMAAIAKDKPNPKRGPWTLTLQRHVYNSFMENCPVPALRWNLWQAYNQRCVEESDSRTKNAIIIEDIREYRLVIAQLLGYRNFTELTLESKMAENPQNVKSMIATLLLKCMPQQGVDIERLHIFAASRGYDAKLNQWDLQYWKKKEKEQLYNTQELSFPFEQTFKTLLSFTSRLFGFEYKEVSPNNYVVKRSGVEIGRFVVDPYKSKSKFPGTYVVGNHLFTTLILNFDPPLYGNETMLNVGELSDLFESFGHLLQKCLCPVSAFITTDFKVPGYFLAMWLGNEQFLENYLGLKGDKLTGYLKSRQHFAATDLCHELYLADFDLELHLTTESWVDMMRKKFWKAYNVLDLDKNMSMCSSNLIHYGSTYYSDTWSRMLAADCYRAFVETKEPKDVAVDGSRFRKSFFEAPVNSTPSEIFRNFRGRDPSPDAFLWSLGLMKLSKLDNKLD